MPESLIVTIDGEAITVKAGTTVAAAILQAGIAGFRQSVSGEPRGPLCGMGICFECRVTVDGEAHVRGCQIMVREGMEVWTDEG